MKNIGENLVNILKAKSKRGILKYKKDGFSLIEVVIAITLMAILSGIAMTSYTKVQQDAKKNMDYTTAANIATAAQLADADGKAVSIENLVKENYLQSTPKSQQKDAGDFEVTIDDYNFSIAGGGRYDKMVGNFCGQDVPATGFSIGFERIITILKDKLENGYKIDSDNVAILIHKDVTLDKKLEIFKEAKELRQAGKTVTIQMMRKNMKQQINMLESEGYTEFKKVYND